MKHPRFRSPPAALVAAFALLACLPLAVSGPVRSAESASLAAVAEPIVVRARALTPGEPLHVEVRLPFGAGRPTALEGRFLDSTFPLYPRDDGTWSGWTMIPLGTPAGRAEISIEGAGGGDPARYATPIDVEEKAFPSESLTVESKYVEPAPEVLARIAAEREELSRIYLRRAPGPIGREPFLRPVDGPPTSVFGTERTLNGKPRDPHAGWDLDAEIGDEVRAADDGVVVLAKDLYYSGGTVILDHGFGLFTIYAHLSSIDVAAGTVAARGDRLGAAGATGRVTGPHLHWGAKIGDRPFDPAALLDPALFPERK